MNLSEQRILNEPIEHYIYSEESVKEFIKKLKKNFLHQDRHHTEYIMKKIDKLAGKELVE